MAVTGAIWMCSLQTESAKRLTELRLIDSLMELLKNQSDEVGGLSGWMDGWVGRLVRRRAGFVGGLN